MCVFDVYRVHECALQRECGAQLRGALERPLLRVHPDRRRRPPPRHRPVPQH